jgi:crotonobetainyl-CoA:carnitine CoA-transferase CaiB-like acyl-CoA transferase
MKPFDELRILDLSQGVAGPYCTMYLADLGCLVIKVEPSWGDWGRTMGVKVGAHGSVVFSALNRGKQSYVIDAQSPQGREALKALASKCDILVESFRPGVMDRLELDWQRVHKLNPRLIYCSVTAFGAEGPYRNKKGTDSILQGLAGFMSITGEEGGSPLKVGLAISDMFAGALAAQAVLSAILLREQDNQGRRIEISLMEALLELQRVQLTEFLITGKPPERKGNAHAHMAPSRSFRTADGDIMVAVITPADWTNFCQALGLADKFRDEFADPRIRVQRRIELDALIEPIFLTAPSQKWLELLEQHDLLCGVIHNYDTLLKDPHVRSLDVIDREAVPATIKSPVRFIKETPWLRSNNAPELGEETEAGLDSAMPVPQPILTNHSSSPEE